MWSAINQLHPLTGIWISLLVIAGGGAATTTAAIALNHYLDRREKRLREQLPRAQVQPSDAQR